MTDKDLPCGFQYPNYRCNMPESVHRGEHQFQPYDRRVHDRRTASPEAPSLDAAWAEAEAALPEDGGGDEPLDLVTLARLHSGEWRAIAGFDAVGSVVHWAVDGRGPTPAAALSALAAKLREKQG